MRFRGKIAKWFYGIMLFAASILMPITVLAIIEKEAVVVAALIAVFALIETFCISVVLRNYAELRSDSLLIVFGLIRLRIRYSDMKKIETAQDTSSSLAASFDRIRIVYGNQKTVMISLQDREGFYEEIRKKTVGVTGIAES